MRGIHQTVNQHLVSDCLYQIYGNLNVKRIYIFAMVPILTFNLTEKLLADTSIIRISYGCSHGKKYDKHNRLSKHFWNSTF